MCLMVDAISWEQLYETHVSKSQKERIWIEDYIPKEISACYTFQGTDP